MTLRDAYYSIEVSGSDIIVLPRNGDPGWIFRRGDIGYAWAQALVEKINVKR
jgi:hypothetical protein